MSHIAEYRATPSIRIKEVKLLSDSWYVLKKTTFERLRSDGSWQEVSRETYDRGNGATILLYNLERRTVILTRQFRYPAYVNGHSGMLIETAAGLLDEASPEDRIKAEVEEETGFVVSRIERVFEAFMSPGSVTERLYFFVAEYDRQAGRAREAAMWMRVKISKSLKWESTKRLQRLLPERSRTARRSCCCNMHAFISSREDFSGAEFPLQERCLLPGFDALEEKVLS